MIDNTSAGMIAAIKREASIPTNQELFTDTDFTEILSSNLRKFLVPQILKVREEFYVTNYDYTISARVRRFALPPRAIGTRLRLVQILDTNNKVVALVQRVSPEVGELSTQGNLSGNAFATPTLGYFFENNDVVLLQDANSVGTTLRLKYYRRPNKIIPVSQAGKITAIDTGTGVVTLDNVPSDWTVDMSVDFISKVNPFVSRGDSIEVLALSGLDVTVAVDAVADLSIGDYVAAEGESPVAQIPEEFQTILNQYAIVDVLKSLGDTQGMSNAMSELGALETAVYEQIADRDDGSAQKPVGPDSIWNYDDYPRWRF